MRQLCRFPNYHQSGIHEALQLPSRGAYAYAGSRVALRGGAGLTNRDQRAWSVVVPGASLQHDLAEPPRHRLRHLKGIAHHVEEAKGARRGLMSAHLIGPIRITTAAIRRVDVGFILLEPITMRKPAAVGTAGGTGPLELVA